MISIQTHFQTKAPVVEKIYSQLLKALKKIGPIHEESKKTSIHLVRKSALAGIATRSDYLILTLKSNRKIASKRLHKSEQVSANRFHHEIKLRSPNEVDAELVGWLKEAYQLSE